MPRRLAIPLALLALTVGAAGAFAPAAHAQEVSCSPACGQGYTCDSSQGVCVPSSSLPNVVTVNPSAGAGQPTQILSNPVSGSVFGDIMAWIAKLFAWLLGVAAITLDNAVYYTVVTMGNYIHNLSAVGVAWRILRDIGNIVLIFGFLAIGVTTILNVNWYGGGTKMLPKLLLAAVFLNFSLFITEAVIDAGNLFATEFYTQINGGNPATPTGYFGADQIAREGISNKIMANLGLQTIYGDAVTNNPDALTASNSWLIGFMAILLFMVAAFVMFSLAFILIARFVVLVFLIIVAPIGFAGWAVPKLSNVANLWWGQLFEQTITAPVLLLLLYVALAIITDANFLTGFCVSGTSGSVCGPDSWLGFFNQGNLANFAGLLLTFLVAMGLLLVVVVIAKKMSAFGAGWAMKWGGAASFGLTAWGGRHTLGWVSQRASDKFSKSRLARVPIVGTSISRSLQYGGKASFDVRSTSALKNIPGGGIAAGIPAKGGYAGEEKKAIEAREKYAKSLELSTGEEARAKAARKEFEVWRDSLSEEERKRRKDEVGRREEGVIELEKKAQLAYAGRLAWGPLGWFNRNKVAAKKIEKEAKKAKNQKALDALQAAIENEEKEKGTTAAGASEGVPQTTQPGGGSKA